MKTLAISPTVEIALSSLGPQEVQRLHDRFDRLRRWDDDQGVRNNSTSLDRIPGVYITRAPGDVHIFFRIDGDTVTILDVARTSAILASGGIHVAGNAEAVVNANH
jgi:hypothetical protein